MLCASPASHMCVYECVVMKSNMKYMLRIMFPLEFTKLNNKFVEQQQNFSAIALVVR